MWLACQDPLLQYSSSNHISVICPSLLFDKHDQQQKVAKVWLTCNDPLSQYSSSNHVSVICPSLLLRLNGARLPLLPPVVVSEWKGVNPYLVVGGCKDALCRFS